MRQVTLEQAYFDLAKAVCRQWLEDCKPESKGQGRRVREYGELIREATRLRDNVYMTTGVRTRAGVYKDRI